MKGISIQASVSHSSGTEELGARRPFQIAFPSFERRERMSGIHQQWVMEENLCRSAFSPLGFETELPCDIIQS